MQLHALRVHQCSTVIIVGSLILCFDAVRSRHKRFLYDTGFRFEVINCSKEHGIRGTGRYFGPPPNEKPNVLRKQEKR